LVEEVHPSIAVISADTVVSLDERPLGKPADKAEAMAMLQALSGRSHTVITAVALSRSNDDRTTLISVSTAVHMRTLDPSEIEQYVERGEPFDKAGGYAIQDAELRPVRAISGCFPNVVGLPLCAVQSLLVGSDNRLSLEAPCHLCKRAAEVLSRHGFWASLLPQDI
jgi:MAF protein